MDQRKDIREFLTSRRARITPQQAGLPDYGAKRRVPGLRREEVALLAGVSVDYYTRLERGNLTGVSDSVLNSVATVLQLDETERAHLFNLIKVSQGPRRTPRKAGSRLRPSVQLILDAMVGVPAWVSNDRLDILAANVIAAELYRVAIDGPGQANLARFVFLDGRAQEFFVDWNQQADNAVAILRSAAARDPYDDRLTQLVGELSTRSDEFRVRWGAHIIRAHQSGPKAFKHPDVGQLDLTFDGLELAADPGLTLYVMTAEPNSATAERLKLLGSLAATRQSHG
ncbi:MULTISPECIES: helix-turn-helix transcriptional regulator [Mycolicibacterium]|uniref:Transcriptional regulator n=1 Tax=Mycolicibacterium phocaicum TaxID=319706 RepID=A0A7I7ZKH8_9MYCO|nr:MULTISPECIES: helix-turn-helix transcriptional regulator [Mycolicibacterium]TLH69814.1 transcriptional regulator [Mycolicibacterium phocaicum]BBZ54560.1 transcriptional regulator [Mycolicibacterium phocaicum]BCI82304.1 transcriptional regulator [Mycolicibacterium sp. TY66]BCJ80050.1 transcriptional regulator [Mycolicibacterium sp. TY81]